MASSEAISWRRLLAARATVKGVSFSTIRYIPGGWLDSLRPGASQNRIEVFFAGDIRDPNGVSEAHARLRFCPFISPALIGIPIFSVSFPGFLCGHKYERHVERPASRPGGSAQKKLVVHTHRTSEVYGTAQYGASIDEKHPYQGSESLQAPTKIAADRLAEVVFIESFETTCRDLATI